MNRAAWQAAHPMLCPGYSTDDGLLYPLLPRDDCAHETVLYRADGTAACIDCGLPVPYESMWLGWAPPGEDTRP